MTPQEAIAVAEAAGAETRYRSQLAREAYEAGRQAGHRQAQADEQARWQQASPVPVRDALSHAELEQRRWGPGGREHFADPRPGDFPGRQTRQPHVQPEPEPELEASP